MSGRKLSDSEWEFSIGLAGRICVVNLELAEGDCTPEQKEDLFRKLKEL